MSRNLTHEAQQAKQAMNALEANETKFRDLVESLKDWVWSIDLKGVHTFTNGAIMALLGYKPEEILNSSTFPLMHPDSKPRAEAVLRKSIAQQKGWRNLELKWLHKDGSSRYFESTAHPDFHTDGNLTGFSGVDRDITARKKAENELLRHQKELKRISHIGMLANASLDLEAVLQNILESTMETVNASAGMIFLKEPDTGNLSWGASTGLSDAFVNDYVKRPIQPDEGLTGRTPMDINLYDPPHERDRIIEILRKSGKFENIEVSFRRKSGEKYYAEFSAKVLSYAGERCLLAQSRDITERKQSELALRVSEEKFSKVFQTAPMLILISSLEEGRILDVNDAFVRLAGYSRKTGPSNRANTLCCPLRTPGPASIRTTWTNFRTLFYHQGKRAGYGPWG